MAGTRRARSDWGTVRKTRNRFTAQYTGADGKRHTPGRSFPTRTDARGWLAAERRLIELGTWTPPEQRAAKEAAASETVGQWLDKFHDSLEQGATARRATTMQNYRRVVRVRITRPCDAGATDADVCSLRGIRLAELTKKDVYRWWDGVQRCYPDAHTINQQAYKQLKAACAEAVRRELLDANPVDIPEAGKKIKPNEKYLPQDWEINAIIDNMPARYRVLASLMLHHGLRIGEALAVELDSVKVIAQPGGALPRVVVAVKQNAGRLADGGNTHMVVQPPKTQAGFREVPILATDVPLFVEHLEKYAPTQPTLLVEGKGTRKARLLTTTTTGAMVMDTSFRSILKRAVERAGASPEIKPHNGRNWLITRLAEQGAHLKEIGKLLGQEDVSVILGVYMKVRAGRTDSLMDKVSATIGEMNTNGGASSER
ncbi:tyrosine-type recombinase/integrase [Corynebacterium sp. ES2794-CONJ1]|uniref:tyrosine-type recombinase/integrase n=1 Tax=Corynebacterium sp. ES2794-CONJ1 TaxID=2980553 RepID=UPI0021DA2EBC|nr:tyrosine-type recombinase/integrase [Corynebacterium sp. ES2794-CONJ1]MCU9518731.1 tyrosine-type recombinase/integrase [Corynebacterium sp. ES2794-CONJ1]